MTKLFKLKYVIIISVLIAAILCGSLISVSYAKWTGNGERTVTAQAGTGKWIKTEDFDRLFDSSINNKTEKDNTIKELLEDLGGEGVITKSGDIVEMGSSFPMGEGEQFVIGGAEKQAIEGIQIRRYGIINGTSLEWMATNPSKNISVDNGVVTVKNPGNFKVVIQTIGGAEWMVIQDA